MVSTPSSPGGWFTEETPPNGGPSYVADAHALDGLGELQFSTPNPSSRIDWYHFVGTSYTTGAAPLASVSGLSYSVRNGSGGPEAAYDMEVFTLGGTSGYTTLVWEPYQNGHPLVADGNWHTYSNLEGGLWWSSHIGSGAGSQASPQPLSFFESKYPAAVVATYAVGQGTHNDGSVSLVDDVSFGGTTWNFEPNSTSDCRARAVGIDSPTPVIFGEANHAEVPCKSDSKTVASVTATIAGVLATVKVTGLSGTTSAAPIGGVQAASASADVATLSISALGLSLKAAALFSAASAVLPSCTGGSVAGVSSVGALTVNGKTYLVGNKPFSISLGLRISINVNQKVVVGNRIIQRALYITWPDHRYNMAFGESIAGLSC